MSFDKEIQYYSQPEKWALKYAKVSVLELLKIVEGYVSSNIEEDDKGDQTVDWNVLSGGMEDTNPEAYYAWLNILNRLGLIDAETVVGLIDESNQKLQKKIDTLELQFKAHRHDFSKPYSEKPVW